MNKGYVKLNENDYLIVDEEGEFTRKEYTNSEELLLENKADILFGNLVDTAKDKKRNLYNFKKYLGESVMSTLVMIASAITILLGTEIPVLVYLVGSLSLTLSALTGYFAIDSKKEAKRMDKYNKIIKAKLQELDAQMEKAKELHKEKESTKEEKRVVSLNDKNIELLKNIRNELLEEYERLNNKDKNVRKLSK